MRQSRLLVFAASVLLPSFCTAQNVSNYPAIADPLLFLLREPAVLDDLQLSAQQRDELSKLNQGFDASLLGSRNKPSNKSEQEVGAVMSATRRRIAEFLSEDQQQRLDQIARRIKGISAVLQPEASEKLKLSSAQLERIKKINGDTQRKIQRLRTQASAGESTQENAQRQALKARREEQTRILEELNAKQQQSLASIFGRAFDLSQLGRVAFKAPELSGTGAWINSPALQMSGLQGKVVALHFWAFG